MYIGRSETPTAKRFYTADELDGNWTVDPTLGGPILADASLPLAHIVCPVKGCDMQLWGRASTVVARPPRCMRHSPQIRMELCSCNGPSSRHLPPNHAGEAGAE